MRGEFVRGALIQPKGMAWDYKQGIAWVPEYSGNDSTWMMFRGAIVWRKGRRYVKP